MKKYGLMLSQKEGNNRYYLLDIENSLWTGWLIGAPDMDIIRWKDHNSTYPYYIKSKREFNPEWLSTKEGKMVGMVGIEIQLGDISELFEKYPEYFI